MLKTKKSDLSATRSQRGSRRQQRPEKAGHARSSTAAEDEAQPPVENQMVASHSPQLFHSTHNSGAIRHSARTNKCYGLNLSL
uniref:Uncharacterized protein n=1 Tax=Magallana gigas TaxID=29159 RepID=K1QK04_MAGGI